MSYAYGAYPRIASDNTVVGPTLRLAQRYNRTLSNPNQIVVPGTSNSVNYNIAANSLAANNPAQFGSGLGGNSFTTPTFGAGAFNNTIAYNTADNSISNAYNLDRSGINYDFRRYRPGYYNPVPTAPGLFRPESLYPSPYPYQPYYAANYGNPNGGPYVDRPYAGPYPPGVYNGIYGLAPPYNGPFAGEANPYSFYRPYGNYDPAFPPYAPECLPYGNCRDQHPNNPNACRSCVIAQGGSAHCADQICGPYDPNARC